MLISIALLIAVAVIAGFASGFFGIGGGVVLVPSLLFILPKLGASAADMHGAVATSLALLVPTAIMATRTQKKLGHFDSSVFRSWGVGIILGAVLGAVVADFISARDLLVCFSAFMCITLLLQFAKKFFSDLETEQPNKSLMLLFSLLIGAVSTVLGIGGGLFSSAALRMLRYPLRRAIAISTASALLIGLVGATSNIITGLGEAGRAAYSFGYINMPAFILIAPFMMLLAPLGVRAANKVQHKTLSKLYIIFFTIMTFIVIHKTLSKF